MTTTTSIVLNGSSQYLTATGKTNINQQKFTIAFWFKRAATGVMFLYSCGDGSTSNRFQVAFNVDNIQILAVTGGGTVINKKSNATYTDTSWHHLLVGVDTTQSTPDNRTRLYVDGAEITSWVVDVNAGQNANLSNNFATTYKIGNGQFSNAFYNGNLAEFYYIDGRQLDPTFFITGVPGSAKNYATAYSGSFDFYLNFSNSSSLGTDFSGEGNSWAPVASPAQSSDGPDFVGNLDPGGAIVAHSYTRKYIEGEVSRIRADLDEPRRAAEAERIAKLRATVAEARLTPKQRVDRDIALALKERDSALERRNYLLNG